MGECEWGDVEKLCREMGIVSLLAHEAFMPWYSKLNRNRGVAIRELLNRWLEHENTNFELEANRFKELLAKTRGLAGEEGLLTRAQCQSLTKEFDPNFKEGSMLQELGALINKLFKDWATPDDRVSYLNLLVAWIDTRQFHTQHRDGAAAAADGAASHAPSPTGTNQHN